jgi:hypothetical protein
LGDDAKQPQREEASAKKKSTGSQFMRIARGEDDEMLSMDTAIVRYVPKDEARAGLVVDLIGAVHVGEKSYYEQLNREFTKYDALLYELVAPEKARVPRKGESSGHPIAMLQGGLKDMLGLEHQLSGIDYRAKNFVHADMSPEQFAKSMADRNESFLEMIFRSIGHGIAQESKRGESDPSMNLLRALFSKDRPRLLKRAMAEQFEDVEAQMNALQGPDGSTIITERNKVALEVLKKEIAAGKKTLGIFYGAGHLPDMEKRLIEDFGLVPQETRWLAAWDLSDKSQPKRPESKQR